jgi:hypothetical protein
VTLTDQVFVRPVLLTALCALALAFAATEVAAKDNAGIYFFGVPPSPEKVAAAAKGARVTVEEHGRFTRITAQWPGVTFVISIDPDWNRNVQLAGIRGWISQFAAVERNRAQVKALLSDLDRTTTCFGSVITPAFDPGGRVVATLLRLLDPTGGFFFAHQSFYDAKGRRILGLPGDPQRLGPRR